MFEDKVAGLDSLVAGKAGLPQPCRLRLCGPALVTHFVGPDTVNVTICLQVVHAVNTWCSGLTSSIRTLCWPGGSPTTPQEGTCGRFNAGVVTSVHTLSSFSFRSGLPEGGRRTSVHTAPCLMTFTLLACPKRALYLCVKGRAPELVQRLHAHFTYLWG